MKPAVAYMAAGLLLGASFTAGADVSPLAFWRLQFAPATVSAPLDIRPKAGARPTIEAANQRAAARHGVSPIFLDRLTMQESRFRFVKGPQTKWGRAHGPHQILCATARSLGEPDCNRLMHDAERSADLAARYIRQGLDATGSLAGAAAYYHGGPNTRLWGKKTQAYARAVAGAPFPRSVNLAAPPQGRFGVAMIASALQPAP